MPLMTVVFPVPPLPPIVKTTRLRVFGMAGFFWLIAVAGSFVMISPPDRIQMFSSVEVWASGRFRLDAWLPPTVGAEPPLRRAVLVRSSGSALLFQRPLWTYRSAHPCPKRL